MLIRSGKKFAFCESTGTHFSQTLNPTKLRKFFTNLSENAKIGDYIQTLGVFGIK